MVLKKIDVEHNTNFRRGRKKFRRSFWEKVFSKEKAAKKTDLRDFGCLKQVACP
jgi:hypothetical protein